MAEIKIANISQTDKRDFALAVSLLYRSKSMSAPLASFIRRTIKQARTQYPQLFKVLSHDEERVLEAIDNGAYKLREIVAHTKLSQKATRRTLDSLAEKHIIEARAQGGGTDAAKGATHTLYVRKGSPSGDRYSTKRQSFRVEADD
jgi:DNA-binding transcriptional ArsR family regulator